MRLDDVIEPIGLVNLDVEHLVGDQVKQSIGRALHPAGPCHMGAQSRAGEIKGARRRLSGR